MKKSIYYLIMCITLCCVTLILYYCANYNPISKDNTPKNGSNTTSSNTIQTGSQTKTNENITLTEDEQNKFNILKNSLDKINLVFTNDLNTGKKNTNNVLTSKEAQNIETLQKVTIRYPGFITWLLKDIPRQKELVNAFDSAYNILENKRKIYASNRTLEQYISDAIDCGFDVSCTKNNDGNNNKYGQYDKYNNLILVFFKDILINMTRQYTNEEIFKVFKADLTNNIVDSLLYLLKKWQ